MTPSTMQTVYRAKQRLRILGEQGLDYIVEDEQGRTYMYDREKFHRDYASEDDNLPVHTDVWEKLDQQARDLHHVKRANSRLKDEVRGLRKQLEQQRKERGERQHYRNGQKRGRTRNG